MKSIKFLAALAVPAMFAACTNEEIVVESPKSFKQVVGAELIGTDISMEMSNGANSRLGGAGWEVTDKLGLGWIVSDSYSSPQALTSAPASNKWYANHLFYVEDNKFITRGNVYKGWHFAYYPYSYMESIGEKTWNVNPPQTSKVWASGRVNDALCISPLKFLTRESLDDNYQLKPEVAFAVERAVSSIHVKTTAADQFAAEGSLANLDVKSIKLALSNDGAHYPFCGSLEMNVKNLPQETTEKITAQELTASFYAAENPVFTKKSAQAITTDVAEAGFKVSEPTTLITLTAPYAGGDLEEKNLSMDVVAGAGTFEIRYVDGAEEGTNAYMNNQALVALKNALARGGDLTKVNTKLELDVVLYADIFKTDFLHITDLTEWKDAVDMVEKLGRTSEEFGIDGIIDFNEGKIPMPEGCSIKVRKADTNAEVGLKITKSIESWPAGLTSEVKVTNEKTIADATGINGNPVVNTGNLKGISGKINSSIVNNGGKISLTKTGELGNVDNTGGRITVVYGSKISLASNGGEGIIAYTVASREYAYKLNNLMNKTSNQTSSAHVNTLIVKEGRTLDLGLTDQGNLPNGDPYYSTGATADVRLASLEDINIELNGGSIVGGTGDFTVNNVTMTGGVVENVNINGTLTTESGEITSEIINGTVTAENATITANKIESGVSANNCSITVDAITGNVTLKGTSTINNATITGNVTVEEGVANLDNVTINGTLTVEAGASVVLNSTGYIYITNIVNNGTLAANNDIFVTNVTLNPKSTTTLTDKDLAEMDWNKTIYYKDNYVNDKMTLNGTVVKFTLVEVNSDSTEKGEALSTALSSAQSGDVVFVPAGEYNLTESSDIVLKGVSIICEKGTVINSSVDSQNNRVLNIYTNGEKNILLKNFEIKCKQSKWDIYVRTNGSSDGDVTNLVMENVKTNTVIIDTYYGGRNITINADVADCSIKRFQLDAWNQNASSINFEYNGGVGEITQAPNSGKERVTITKK